MMRGILTKLTLLNLLAALLVGTVLYLLMDRGLSSSMNAAFSRYGEVVARELARSVEPSLIAHDLATVQSSLDRVLDNRDVAWAYDLPILRQSGNSGSEILYRHGNQTASIFTSPILDGVIGTVYVGFIADN